MLRLVQKTPVCHTACTLQAAYIPPLLAHAWATQTATSQSLHDRLSLHSCGKDIQHAGGIFGSSMRVTSHPAHLKKSLRIKAQQSIRCQSIVVYLYGHIQLCLYLHWPQCHLKEQIAYTLPQSRLCQAMAALSQSVSPKKKAIATEVPPERHHPHDVD